jgi:hypothetical protein
MTWFIRCFLINGITYIEQKKQDNQLFHNFLNNKEYDRVDRIAVTLPVLEKGSIQVFSIDDISSTLLLAC